MVHLLRIRCPRFRLIIEQLRRNSYRVILLLTALRQDALESIDASQVSADRERQMREFIATPPYLGAEGIIELRDAQTLWV